MASADNIGLEIARLSAQNYNTRSQLGDLSEGQPYLQFFSDNYIKLKVKKLQIRKRSYLPASGILIWGHPSYGKWGTGKWGTVEDAFGSWSDVYNSGDL